ncbi:MAG: AzlD domain-containing protein [Actinobacteria bacterium]|nr:AzlD domain-containing protein [Actinomycetota bacterium]
MGDLLLILAMAAVTYGSRVVFLAGHGEPPAGFAKRFLDRFPLALFAALAASILVVPDPGFDARHGWAALAGAALGGVLTKRSLYGVVGFGFAAYWLARWVVG